MRIDVDVYNEDATDTKAVLALGRRLWALLGLDAHKKARERGGYLLYFPDEERHSCRSHHRVGRFGEGGDSGDDEDGGGGGAGLTAGKGKARGAGKGKRKRKGKGKGKVKTNDARWLYKLDMSTMDSIVDRGLRGQLEENDYGA